MRGRVEIGVLALGVILALFTGWMVLFGDVGGGATAKAEPAGGGQTWIVVDQGRTLASPSTSSPSSPGPSPSAPVTAPPAAPNPLPSGTPTCAGGDLDYGQPAGLSVDPEAGAATVSWYHPGDPDLVEYKLTAMPQVLITGLQPDLRWETVEPGAPCRTITARITGLNPDAPYVFSLDAVSKAYNADGNRTVTIARSTVVTIG